MNVLSPKKIVLLGLMTKMPVAGNIWLILQYLIGLRRLGYDPYYVESHAVYPGMLMQGQDGDSSERAAAFLDRVLKPFDFGGRWAFHALHDDGRCYGLSDTQLRDLYRSAALILNVHGGTLPLPEHSATGHLVYLGTDPVQVEVELYDNRQETIDFMAPHSAFFTWGENYGNPDCRVPVSERFHFKPTRAPVVLDLWQGGPPPGDRFTTIGNWNQSRQHKNIVFRGEVYTWSKHHEFLKFLDLPLHTSQQFELALSSRSFDDADRQMLGGKGWKVRDALTFSTDLDAYRRYIGQSRGEFTVAKDQNVRLRSGWFSERSAQYLAAGRPVVTQETGFSNILPTGEGLFGFSTLEEIVQAVERVNGDYERHSRAAAELAREYFNYDVVLPRMLADLGLDVGTPGCNGRHAPPAEEGPASPFPAELDILPTSRWPTRLAEATAQAVLARPVPECCGTIDSPGICTGAGCASVVVVTFNNLVYTRMCLESLLANTTGIRYEVVIVDNGSTDDTPTYLSELARRHPQIRLVSNDRNLGFARANNQGLALATGEVLVLLNNDTLVPPGWLPRLIAYLEDASVGLVGPVTNRTGNEAQIEVPYRTYGEMARFAAERAQSRRGERFDLRMVAMFCTAMRRGVFERVGPLDERFEVGLFEDDDYALRVRAAGYRVVCAEDAFVHHFGQASLGQLGQDGEYGEYGRLFHENRRRWEAKWFLKWQPYKRRRSDEYRELVGRVRKVVEEVVPPDATVIVVSRGDEELLDLNGRQAWHFPRAEDGSYAGHHPADSKDAIRRLKELGERGAGYLVIPEPSLWWLEHYTEFADHLRDRHAVTAAGPDCRVFRLEGQRPKASSGVRGMAGKGAP